MSKPEPEAFLKRHGMTLASTQLIESSAQFVAGFAPPDYLMDGVLQRGFIYSLTGRTGNGKTGVALYITASIALGKAIGSYGVERGRVLYLAGENDIDARMRWIAMASHMNFDLADIDAYFIAGRFQISAMMETVKKEVHALGGVTLIVVDTSAVFFEGRDANDNVEQGLHARRLRDLTKLAGGPCVLVLCHPTKNAGDENLVPYGGGAFLNEMDGNLTCRKQDGTVEVHWQGKYRGPDFAPVNFQLQTVVDPKLVDSKGRTIPTVIARHLSDADKQQLDASARRDEDSLLKAIGENPGASQAELARLVGWFMSGGQPYKVKVARVAKALQAAGLIKDDRGDLVIAEKGKNAVTRACSDRSVVPFTAKSP